MNWLRINPLRSEPDNEHALVSMHCQSYIHLHQFDCIAHPVVIYQNQSHQAKFYLKGTTCTGSQRTRSGVFKLASYGSTAVMNTYSYLTLRRKKSLKVKIFPLDTLFDRSRSHNFNLELKVMYSIVLSLFRAFDWCKNIWNRPTGTLSKRI